MISFDEFIKQDDEEKYNNMQHDLLEIERLNNIIEKNKYSADELNEIERLNNIISELEKELFGMYVDIAGWSEDYAKNRIKELKGVDKE